MTSLPRYRLRGIDKSQAPSHHKSQTAYILVIIPAYPAKPQVDQLDKPIEARRQKT